MHEIDAMGFRFLRQILYWVVKQSIMVQLARAYNIDTSTLRLDVGNIPINTELIERLLDIPSSGDDYPELDKNNASHMGCIRDKTEKDENLKGGASKKSTKPHSKEVYQKMARKISALPMHGYNSGVLIRIFAWLFTYFLDVSEQGSTRATEMEEGPIKRQSCKKTEPPPSRLGHTKPSEKHSTTHNISGRGTKRKVRIVKGKSCIDSTKSPAKRAASRPKETPFVASDSDDEDNEPIAKRMRRLFQYVKNPVDENPGNDEVNVNQEKIPEKPSDPKDPDLVTPSTALVQFTGYDFDRQIFCDKICCLCPFCLCYDSSSFHLSQLSPSSPQLFQFSSTNKIKRSLTRVSWAKRNPSLKIVAALVIAFQMGDK
ncbi:hypothetical protein AHAS_Ahas17G0163200 [Arachis hypogaea]